MSGSNKFSNIKRRKGAQDAQRSRMYSRLSQEIAVAVRAGGNNPALNASLRVILQKARSQNMPRASIERALQRGTGGSATSLRTAIYEGRLASGIALVIEVRTDNGNRTTAFVRSTLQKHGGALLRTGSVSHLFAERGTFVCEGHAVPDALVLALMDEGLEDEVRSDGQVRLLTAREGFARVRDALREAGVVPLSADLQRVCHTARPVDTAAWTVLERLVHVLQEHQDVYAVTHDAARGSGA